MTNNVIAIVLIAASTAVFILDCIIFAAIKEALRKHRNRLDHYDRRIQKIEMAHDRARERIYELQRRTDELQRRTDAKEKRVALLERAEPAPDPDAATIAAVPCPTSSDVPRGLYGEPDYDD